MCSDDSNSTFGCWSNPDLLPKPSWLGFYLLSYLIPCPTDLLSTFPWLPRHSATHIWWEAHGFVSLALVQWLTVIMFSLKAIPTLLILSLALLIHQVLSWELWELKQRQKSDKSQVTSDNAHREAHSSSCFWRTGPVATLPELGCSALSSMWASTIHLIFAKWQICFWCLHL